MIKIRTKKRTLTRTSKLLTSNKQEDTFGPKIMFIDKNNNVVPPGRDGGNQTLTRT